MGRTKKSSARERIRREEPEEEPPQDPPQEPPQQEQPRAPTAEELEADYQAQLLEDLNAAQTERY